MSDPTLSEIDFKKKMAWVWTTLNAIYTLADAGNNDRVVIQELVKEIAGTRQINSKEQKSFKVRSKYFVLFLW